MKFFYFTSDQMSGQSGGFLQFLGRPKKKDKKHKNRRRAISAEELNRPTNDSADDESQMDFPFENHVHKSVTIKKERTSLPNSRRSLAFTALNQSLEEDTQNNFPQIYTAEQIAFSNK